MPSALEEKDAIREVLAIYCFHLDAGNFEDMAALFTEDGTWHTDFGKGTGRAGHHRACAQPAGGQRARGRAACTWSPTSSSRSTATQARVQSNWIVAQNTDAGPKVSSAGGYTDDMVKQDGRWLFRYRKIDRFIARGQILKAKFERENACQQHWMPISGSRTSSTAPDCWRGCIVPPVTGRFPPSWKCMAAPG